MKKLILSLMVLTHPFLMQASEQQSWYGKNKAVGIAAAAVATASGLFAGLSLLAWNNWRNIEKTTQKEIDDTAALQKQKENLEFMKGAADRIKENHMTKNDVLSDGDITQLGMIESAPAELRKFLQDFKTYKQPNHGMLISCEACNEAKTGNYHGPRSKACPAFLSAYSPFRTAIDVKKDEVAKAYGAAQPLLPKRQQSLGTAQNNKITFARMSFASATLAAASLGVICCNRR